MNKLCKISLLVVAMMFATIANAYNFTIGNISGKQGETKTISIGLNNETEDITAFAGEFQVPEGVEIVYDADEEEYAFALSGRKSTTHILGSAKQTNGNIMVTCYSSKNKVFTGTSGELFTGQLKLTGSPGTYTLKLVNAYVTSTAAKDFTCADVTFTVTIEDENASGNDNPGGIDPQPQGAYAFTVANISGAQNSIANFSVALVNETEDITAFAGEFQVPEGVEIIYNADEEEYAFALSGRKSTTHILGSAKQTNGNIMVTCYSSKNKVFTGTSGELFTGQLKLTGAPGTYTLRLVNAYVTSTAAKDFPCADVTFTVTIEEENTGGEDGPGSADLIPSTDISAFENALYFNDVEHRAGDFNLELNMKNAEENITAFQCDVYLPEGVTWKTVTDKRGNVSFALPTFNEERTDNSYHTIAPIAKNDDGSYNIIVYSMDLEYILDNDGVLMTLPLEISEDMEAGDYNIFIKKIVLTDLDKQPIKVDDVVSKLTIPSYALGDANGDDEINVADIVETIAYIRGNASAKFIFAAADVNEDTEINVADIVNIISLIRNGSNTSKAPAMKKAMRKAPATPTSSNLEVIPFALTEGKTSTTVQLDLNNPEDVITAFQCDVIFPEGIEWASTIDRRGNKKYTDATFNVDADRTDASYHTVNVGPNADGTMNIIVYSMTEDIFLEEEGAILDMPFTFNKDLAPGVYDITLKNIVLTLEDKTPVKAADYTFSVIVGSPTGEAVALHGNYTDAAIAALNAALASNTELCAIDLSEATKVSDKTAFATGNKNLMLYVAEGAKVMNTQNVISGGTCANLVLTDGYDFSAPKAFTAASASYKRNVSKEWGTIMLPYAVSSTADVQYYALSDVDLENGVLTFDEATTVDANTPAVYKASGSVVDASASSVDVPVCGGIVSGAATGGLKLTGTYEKTTLTDLDPAAASGIYYIKDNKFWRGNVSVTIPAFRAYFEALQAGSKVLSIGNLPTSIEAIGIDADSKIYTIDGMMTNKDMKSLPSGMYIQNNKKIIIKK